MNLLGAIGGRPAERNLEKILEELDNPKLASHVIKAISDLNTALRQLDFVPRYMYRRRFAQMQYKVSMDKVNDCPDKVKSHAHNSMKASYRKWLGELNQKELESPQELDKSRPDGFDSN